jgi:hypothetical protein
MVARPTVWNDHRHDAGVQYVLTRADLFWNRGLPERPAPASATATFG